MIAGTVETGAETVRDGRRWPWRPDPDPPNETAGRKNMVLLVQLRWLAVAGQLVTIVIADRVIGVRLPVAAMLVPPAGLMLLNIVSLALMDRHRATSNGALFAALLFDIAGLSAELYLSGGASNPFVSLLLVQVVLAAVLLEAWSAWAIVAITALSFGLLTVEYRPLDLPERHSAHFFSLYLQGSLIGFVLVASLLVLFVTRITGNLRDRDQSLADIRQQAAEEDHIVRMGLLASGAAHELGTPLASISVILGDWQRMPALRGRAEIMQEIGEMQAAVRRCKAIVSGILASAGEARGEAPAVTSLRGFLDGIVADWRGSHAATAFDYTDLTGAEMRIVADTALRQAITNVLDNAADASPGEVALIARRDGAMLSLEVTDLGAGFSPEILPRLGKPYLSSKGRQGGGIGLFLATNVMRTLGGRLEACNRMGGGAQVTLTFPLAAIAIEPAAAVT